MTFEHNRPASQQPEPFQPVAPEPTAVATTPDPARKASSGGRDREIGRPAALAGRSMESE